MATDSELCSSVVKCLFDFQTGIAGVFAILAAIYSARVILSAAKLPIDAQNAHKKEQEERKKNYIKQIASTMSRHLKRPPYAGFFNGGELSARTHD